MKYFNIVGGGIPQPRKEASTGLSLVSETPSKGGQRWYKGGDSRG